MAKYKTRFRQANGEPLPLYVHPIVDPKTGILRTYYRRGDQRGTIGGAALTRNRVVELSTKWWDQYYTLRHGRPLPDADPDAPVERGQVIPGSWDALMAHYTTCSRQWLGLKESTRSGYRPYHLLISTVLGRHRVAKTNAATIEALIQKKEFGTRGHSGPAPGAARQLRTTFGLLCEHARKQLKWIAVNPIPDIDKPRPKNKQGWHTWSESQVNAWRLAFPDPASDARCFLEMGLAWGARAGDLCRLGFRDIEDGVIGFTPEKTEASTGAEVHLPVKGTHLLAVLAQRSPAQRYFFQQPPRGSNQHNRDKLVALKPVPWSYTRLRKSFVEWRAAAGLCDTGPDRCVIHGLRKTFATRMSNASVDLQDIADALGDTLESAKIYIAKRDKRKGAARGVNAVSEAA